MVAQKRRAETVPLAKRKKTALSPSQTLYVNNLNDQILRQVLKHNLYLLFSTYGDVLEIVIRPKMRGQAHVILESVSSALAARASLDKRRFFSKEMGVSYAKSKSHLIARANGEDVHGDKTIAGEALANPERTEEVPRYE